MVKLDVSEVNQFEFSGYLFYDELPMRVRIALALVDPESFVEVYGTYTIDQYVAEFDVTVDYCRAVKDGCYVDLSITEIDMRDIEAQIIERGPDLANEYDRRGNN